MQSVYTIFYNTGNDVSHLRYCNGYSHAEELMESVAEDFMKLNYTGVPRKICKYDDNVDTCIKLNADKSFPEGIVFVQKKYEMTIYKKTILPGKVYNSSEVKYLGRFGVMAQQQELSEHQRMVLESLREQLFHKEQLLNQQEQLIRRQELEISRLDRQCGKLNEEIGQLQVDKWYSAATGTVNMPNTRPPKTVLNKQNETITPVLNELKNAFANNSLLLKSRKVKKPPSTDDVLEQLIFEISEMEVK